MNNHWPEVSLDEVVEINPSRRLLRGGDSIYVAMDDLEIWQRQINQWARREFSGSGSKFQNGDTLLARITPCLENGKTAFVTFLKDGENAHGSTEFIVLSSKQGITDKLFIYYLARSESFREFAIQRMEGSSGRQRVPSPAIANFEFKLPPIDEQYAITKILGALDDKIELNRQMNETLETMAQSLFRAWFMDASQADPKGWHISTISELCDINTWALGKNDELERIEYVEISEVSRGNILNIQHYERGKEPSRARRRLRHGDTVLSTVRPDRGSYFLSLNPSPSLIASTGFAVLTPNNAPWSFVHAAMTQPYIFEYLGQQADGGAYPAVRPEIIGALEVPVPDKLEILESFHHACAPLYERAELNRQESRNLAALRDTLLPKLLSGELRLPQGQQIASNIISLFEIPPVKPARKASDEFVEAVVIAQLTRHLCCPKFKLLGRKRYNKFSYLAHRKTDDDVREHYLKKAAGPYSPWAKYAGPEKIALKNGYITHAKDGQYTGFAPGDKVAEIDRYLNYPICAAVDWAVEKFRYKKTDELELLATVDYAVLDLLRDRKPVSWENVKHVIATNKEWVDKLKREIFSDVNIIRALNELRGIFPGTYIV